MDLSHLRQFRERNGGDGARGARTRRLLYLAELYEAYVNTSCVFDTTNTHVELTDPILQAVIYSGRQNAKDLFFSGHTATIALFGLVFDDLRVRWLFFTSAALIGVLLLAQHAHFSVDVLAAPFGSYAAVHRIEVYG